MPNTYNKFRASQLLIPLTALTAEQVSSETVSIPAGAAGSYVNFYIARKPILDNNNNWIGGLDDTSLSLTTSCFTNEVAPGTEDAAMSNGDYWVDHITGHGRGRKADTATSMTADYYVFAAQGGTVTINGTATDNAVITADGTSGDLQYRSNVTINDNGEFSANADTDRSNTFGRVLLSSASSDGAYFSHVDHSTTTAAGLYQLANGNTIVNAPTGQTVRLAINGSTEVILTSVNFYPAADDGNALGIAGTAWADLFLAAGAVINFANGGVTLTHDNTNDRITIASGALYVNHRLLGAQGADVASANDITLGNGNYFDVTGTTQINTIVTTGWTAGSMVTLQFDGSLTVAHNTAGSGASILLAGAGNFSATAGDTLTLIYDGTTWREIARTAI